MKYKYLLAIIGFILLISIPGTMLYVYGADTWDEYLEYTTDSDNFLVQELYYYVYEPQKDITIYELAKIMPIFPYALQGSVIDMIEGLPPEAKRHFRKEE